MHGLMLLISLFVVGCSATSPYQYAKSGPHGSYSFGFNTGEEGGRHSRQEIRTVEGVVSGRYSYNDPTGNLRSVQYRAGQGGYVASGHVGSVRSPKAHLPIFEVETPTQIPGSEKEVSTEPSGEEFSQTVDSPKEEEGKLPDKELGFFVLGLGGKRRLEKASDTGMLDSPPEPSSPKPPIILYPFFGLPYSSYSSRPILIPYTYPHFPYVPYMQAVRSPLSKSYSSHTNFQTY